MPRPRVDSPSPATLRKRRQRDNPAPKMVETVKATAPPPGENNRLVAVTVLVPREDVRVIEFTADRLRKIARVEVPK